MLTSSHLTSRVLNAQTSHLGGSAARSYTAEYVLNLAVVDQHLVLRELGVFQTLSHTEPQDRRRAAQHV